MKKGFIKRMTHGQRGITGLETAIILIAFVVVASVFAYTVLSSGLFSTQKAQEAVYGGLSEAQSTLQLKGSVVANGVAQLNNCDYLGWEAVANTTIDRETTIKMEGSASLKATVATAGTDNDILARHAVDTMGLADGDTLSFFVKFDATETLDNHITFALSDDPDIFTNATQTYVVNNGGSTNWTQHTITLAGGNDAGTLYYGFYLHSDNSAAGNAIVYIDNVRFDAVDAFHGEAIALDNCDYPKGWVEGSNTSVTRETTEVTEGLGSIKAVISSAGANETTAYHAMKAKDWIDGDTITFWIKADGALASDLVFHLSSGIDLNATSIESYAITTSGTSWEKHTMQLSGDEDNAVYYGITTTAGTDGTFYVDGVTCPANHSDNNDPMLSYASDIVFTVGNALGGEPIDFTPTVDTDKDGIISDETTKSHKVVISFSDSYTQVTDLAWTRTAVGTDDTDTLLESNEKFAVTVDLTYVNDNTGALSAKQKITANHKFRVELKPHKGAVLTIERTLPIRVRNVMNLD